MTMEIPKAAIRHAEQEYPREACGLIVNGRYWPCRNIAEGADAHFVMAPGDLRRGMRNGEIQAYVHSHPDWSSEPSQADRVSCEETETPWLILEIREGKHVGETWVHPAGYQAPLIGREFHHGVLDCLTIILDYYRRERGVELGDFERQDGWWDKGGDLYRQHLPQAGFREMPLDCVLEEGDVILMQIRAPVPNHAGIYLARGVLDSEPEHYPSPSCILHHMYGQDSRRDPYGGMWRERTVGVWRYVGKSANGAALRETRG